MEQRKNCNERRMRSAGCLLMIVLCLTVSSFSQTPAETQADKLLQDSKWKEAEQSYASIVSQAPANAAAWAGLGEAQLQQKKFADADRSFSTAIRLKFRPVSSKMNLARVAAAQGDRTRLLGLLRSLIDEGQGSRARAFLAYKEFDSFRSDPEFSRIVAEEMLPCRTEHYRDFDFWIGEWQVYDPQEKQVLGHNSVTKEQDGCLLVEHWKSGRGTESGTSFNYFDKHDSTWHQLYIDNSGDSRAYPPLAGRLVDGKMTLLSDLEDGVQTRWTWYPLAPGKVRQEAEQTKDSGKSWSVSWDSVYVKQ